MADTFGGAKGSPYYGIPDVGNIDINKIGGRKGPDYIPYNQKGRDPFGRVSFNTGIFWLGGFVVGGLKGVAEQTRTPCPSWRLRINSVLNGVSKTGSLWGNSLGVAAFTYTLSGALLDYAGVEHYIDSKLAIPAMSGFITGFAFKSNSTPRAMALAGALGGTVAVGYTLVSSEFDRFFGRGGKF